MNHKLEMFKQNIQNKRVAVLGLGISNTPLVKFLHRIGVRGIACFDRAEPNALLPVMDALGGLDLAFYTGRDYLQDLTGFDVIFKTPVVRFDIPELMAARAGGAWVTSEMEVFCDLCPAPIYGITGSDGKTTTTTLVNEMLSRQGFVCHLGGNIGTPLLDRIEQVTPEDRVVLELSSFQLHTLRQRIHTAVITNLSPNHLDVHRSYEEYVDAKKNIYRYQHPEDRLILNLDNEDTRTLRPEAPGTVAGFSRKGNLADDMDGVFTAEGKDGVPAMFLKRGDDTKKIVDLSSILLPGVHNQENIMAAAAAVSGEVSVDVMAQIASEFKGVAHRLENIRTLNGITFINDSIATSPNRTIAGLESFPRKVILIAGGKDKNLDFSGVGKVLAEHVKSLFLIGETSEKIAGSLAGTDHRISIHYCTSYPEAVTEAYLSAAPGDVVLLSPASTSFDLFKNFEERGNLFKQVVNSLQ
ncbi:MAG TPA: UDP-N-acetylmuramoyl-L-alanine--D-glutamate ligase [Clostridiales bacterium]|nr:UDP-N-acetylmuramoyl-L-alanine--D-glutamate ligase [Clostridiales bacterium]